MTAPASWVYLHLAADGSLLYVGKTHARHYRQRAHSVQSSWWPQVAEVDHFGPYDETEALQIEAALIATHQPPHNVLGTDRASAMYLARSIRRRRLRAARESLRAEGEHFPSPSQVAERASLFGEELAA